MASKLCVDCGVALHPERSAVRCYGCVERNMGDHHASEMARALAALRPRSTFTCEVCGQPFEAWVRDKQPARTCSPACRQKLYRGRKRPVSAPIGRVTGT